MIKKTFTLIEVLVAMSVFLVGITPLLGVMTSLTFSHIDVMNKNKSSMFLQHKMKELIDKNEHIADESTTEHPSIKNMFYDVNVFEAGDGRQQVYVRVGSSANLAGLPFNSFPDYDGRVDAQVSFFNVYALD